MNAEELIERLKKSFHAPSTKDEKFKVVLVCIVISTTFWFFNALNQEDYSTQINYPIEWTFDQTKYQVVGELPARIPIEVNGGGWDLMARSFGFNMPPLQIVLLNPEQKKSMLTSKLRGDLSRNLDPVSITYIIKDSLIFDIQERVNKVIKLQVDDRKVSMDSDYKRSSSYMLEPDSIVVTGPSSIIAEMSDTMQLVPELSDIDSDVNEEIPLPVLPDYIDVNLSQVNLIFEVIRYIAISEEINVELLNLPDSLWTPTVSDILVNYSIGETEFDATDSTRIRLVADFNRMVWADSTIAMEIITGRPLIEEVSLAQDSLKLFRK